MSKVSLKPEMVLNAININLNQQFFVETRDYSKSLFKSLADGERQPLMKFEMGDNGEVMCHIELEVSEHVGKLNYGKFRKGLAMMMIGIQQRLEAQTGFNTLSSDNGEILFNVPGILKTEDEVNVLVCSFKQLAAGIALIRLMYINPETYAKSAGIDFSKLEQNDQEIDIKD